MIEFSVRTPAREALVNITAQIQSELAQHSPGLDGVVHVFIPHTTAGVTINEGADPAVVTDILDSLTRLVPLRAGYLHGEGNSDGHIKCSLMGCATAIPVVAGRLRLGTWQSVYLAEFDGPRSRRVWLQPVSG